MSLRQILLAVVALLITGLLFMVLSHPQNSNNSAQTAPNDSQSPVIDQAAKLKNVAADIQRETPALLAESGTATLEFYFRSEHGVEGGTLSLNDIEHVFEGNYIKIDGVVANSYSAVVNARGHVVQKRQLAVEEGEAKTIDLDLERAVTVRGKVMDANGQAVIGASVAALEDVVDDSLYSLALAEFFNYGNMPTWTSEQTVTDQNGEYEMTNLKVAHFNILVSHDEYRPFKTQSAVELTVGQQTLVETIIINEGTHVHLSVINRIGESISSATAQWRPNSMLAKTVIQRGSGIPTFEADADGMISIKSLPSDVLTFSVNAAGFAQQDVDIDLSSKAAGEIVVHTVNLNRGFNVSGSVLNADGDTCENTVVALGNAKDFSIETAGLSNHPLQMEVDSEGGFEFSNISNGQYYLIAAADHYARKVVGPFTVSDGDSVGNDLVITRGATLIVTVLDDEDIPLPKVMVTAVSVEATNFARGPSDESGMITFNNVTAGNYQVSSVDTASGTSADVQFKFVELADDEVVEVALGGIQPTATLSGTVSRAGELIHRARVSIITDSGAKAAATDEEGKYTIPDMPLGDFILIVNVNSGLNGNSAFYGSINITSEGDVQHDVELPNAGLEVHVTAASDGKVLAQVPVAVRPLNGTNISGGDFGLTNAEGVAKFPSLNDGEYMVSVGTAAASFISPQDNGLGSKIISGISVRDNMGIERIDVSLSEGATVKVQVSNQAGELMSGVHMHYLDANGQPMNIISLTGTNAKGVAQLKGLPTGPGRIMVRHPELGMSEFEVNLSDGELFKKQVTLNAGTKLMVTVVDDNDQPLSGVLCTALDHRGAALSYVWALSETQATQSAYFSGTAQKLGPLPMGNYKIQLIRPGKDIVIHDVFVNGESVQNLRLGFSEE